VEERQPPAAEGAPKPAAAKQPGRRRAAGAG